MTMPRSFIVNGSTSGQAALHPETNKNQEALDEH
jgi:hypothetical protein